MGKSLWTDTVTLPERETLRGDVKTEVLIIGGGICGILCACLLKKAGVDCLLVEGDRIAGGITGNTTAKVTSQHGLVYDRMLHTLGQERTRLYLEANEKALEKYRELCAGIPCDWEEQTAFVYSRQDGEKIRREVEAVNALGFPAEFVSGLPLPFPVEGAIAFPRQAQFHPLKFVEGIIRDLPIYEHTFVENIEGHTAVTSHGKIQADQFIVATHFPFINRHGSYFLKLYQQRSYVLALEQAARLEGMYIDEAQGGLSFRSYGELLLLGGGGHRTGKKGGGFAELEAYAAELYPQAKVRYRWAAQDCMSLDGIPYIGRYSAGMKNLFTATGFQKWGMTTSMVAAMLLCDLVRGRDNDWAEVFSPSRSMVRPQLFVNAWEAVTNLLTPSLKRCPHMGCVLKWNAQEHTWDCPCHGSRFERDGELIDNPAKRGCKCLGNDAGQCKE